MSFKGMLTRILQGSPNSARIAKERLQIILSQQRGASSLQGVDVANMQHQIREVVAKFMKVDDGDISWTVKPSEEDASFDVFEMQVQLQPRAEGGGGGGSTRGGDTPRARWYASIFLFLPLSPLFPSLLNIARLSLSVSLSQRSFFIL